MSKRMKYFVTNYINTNKNKFFKISNQSGFLILTKIYLKKLDLEMKLKRKV